MTDNSNINTTKQRILDCAANLFAEKGFTETTTREMAEALGLNSASLYYHFASKNAILEQIMEDYSAYNSGIFKERNIFRILQENPTTDGILSCLQLIFPPERREYYTNVLCVLLQEQFRNQVVCAYVAKNIIQNSEANVMAIINTLKELGALDRDTDPDYWMKLHSSLVYSFATRMMLGIGDTAPDYTGMGMVEILRNNFDLMFEKYGTAKAGETG